MLRRNNWQDTLGAGRPNLKACTRSLPRTKPPSAKLNSSFNSCCTSAFSKTSGRILVGSRLPAYSYAECTLLWQGITRRHTKLPTTPSPSKRDQSISFIRSATWPSNSGRSVQLLSGLKEEVKYMVTAQHPNSVNKAYEHAMHYELALESASEKSILVPRCRIPKERARLSSNYLFLSTYEICIRKMEVERDKEETSKVNFT